MFHFRKYWVLATMLVLSSVLLSACTFKVPWQKQVSGIQVSITEGTAAQIFLDDLHLGETPLKRDTLKPGVYKLRIEPNAGSGKQSYETEIQLYPGSLTSVLWSFAGNDPTGTGDILELEPLPSEDRAELSVITLPEGASVLLNTTTYGLSPVVLDSIDAGQYSLSVQAVGHVKKTLPVQVQKGYRLHIFSRLEKESSATAEPVSETVTSSPSAQVATPMPTNSPTSANKLAASPTPAATPKPVVAATPSPATAPLTPPYVTIKTTETGWLRVRDQASSSGVELAKVDVGKSFPYKSTLNGWYEIEYAPAKTGWISGQFGQLVR